MRSCLGSNYYYVNDSLIIMNIKREILKSLYGTLRKNIFSTSEKATHKPNNLNIKHSVTVKYHFNNKFYFINDLLIIMTLNERY